MRNQHGWITRRGWVLGALGAMMAVTGCVDPLARSDDDALREELLASYRQRLASLAGSQTVELQRDTGDVEDKLPPERREELDRISGYNAYDKDPLILGPDLLGESKTPVVLLSLSEAIDLAVKNNLSIRAAKLTPAIAQTQVTQALANFDAVFFADAGYSDVTTFQPTVIGGGSIIIFPIDTQTTTLGTGVRKNLISGGQATVSTQLQYNQNQSSGGGVEFWDSDVTLGLTQPLLRGFGSDVNRAQIVLTQNARRAELEQLRSDLIDLCANVESGYWQLVFTKQQLLILTRLLDRTIVDRDRLQKRADFDVNPVQLTEANSFVELRRSDVIRARQQVRLASDQLKQLVNAPDIPVADETLVVPTDRPADVPVTFSLLDAVTTAMQHRPDLRIALLQIKDASVRQRVADNARLPALDLNAQINFNGQNSNNPGKAYEQLSEGEFVDYIIAGQFEVPIGNRGPQAFLAQRMLERQQAVISYQAQAQLVTLDVKNALRDLLTSYELIGSSRASRLAAADNLRAIEAQEEAGVALTPEFINLKLQAQERLASAETQEIQSLTDYNNAIAALYQATGTLLGHNRIEFEDEGEI